MSALAAQAYSRGTERGETATPLFRDLLLSAGRHFSVLMIRLSGRRTLHHGPFVREFTSLLKWQADMHSPKKRNSAQALQLQLEGRGPSSEPGTLLQVS